MRVTPWGRLVIISALLVMGGSLAVLGSELGSRHQRLVSYPVSGSVEGVAFDVGDADVVIVGGGGRSTVDVQRRERYAFDQRAMTRRTVERGVVRVHSRCPSTLTRACAVRYRVVVPDNVPVDVRTEGGSVSFQQYRGSARVTTGGGDISVDGFCGFSLRATAQSGDVTARAACAPQRMVLRASTGSVHAIVPAGRYQLDAQSASGRQVVRGVSSTPDAPFSIQALSSAGDVLVERAS
jgi:Putative adhesin